MSDATVLDLVNETNRKLLADVRAREADAAVLQDDLRDMLQTLDMFDGARPQSPHEVFRECIEEVKRLKAKEPRNICERLTAARRVLDDASDLLRTYYLTDDTPSHPRELG